MLVGGDETCLLLTSLAAGLVWLLPVVGPFADPARADMITTSDVDPGGTTDPCAVEGHLYVDKSANGTLNSAVGSGISNTSGYLGNESSSADVAVSTGPWRRHTGPQEDLSGHGNWITFGFGLQLVARRSSTLITHCVYVEITK